MLLGPNRAHLLAAAPPEGREALTKSKITCTAQHSTAKQSTEVDESEESDRSVNDHGVLGVRCRDVRTNMHLGRHSSSWHLAFCHLVPFLSHPRLLPFFSPSSSSL